MDIGLIVIIGMAGYILDCTLTKIAGELKELNKTMKELKDRRI